MLQAKDLLNVISNISSAFGRGRSKLIPFGFPAQNIISGTLLSCCLWLGSRLSLDSAGLLGAGDETPALLNNRSLQLGSYYRYILSSKKACGGQDPHTYLLVNTNTSFHVFSTSSLNDKLVRSTITSNKICTPLSILANTESLNIILLSY